MPGFNPNDRTTGSEDYLTPPDVIRDLGPFDLDPCACPEPRPWPTAKNMISLPEDGLAACWFGKRVWLNPPYGNKTSDFMERLANHGNGIALVFARTETAWFQEHAARGDAFFFSAGRYVFYRPDGQQVRNAKTGRPTGAGAPSVLIAFGSENAYRLEVYSRKTLGLFVRKMERTHASEKKFNALGRNPGLVGLLLGKDRGSQLRTFLRWPRGV